MYLKTKILLLIFCLSIFCTKIFSQQDSLKLISKDSSKPLRIAVLLPLYIDSAFDNYDYKLQENFIPQYILTGLDFYNGVMLAIDSLQKEGINCEVHIYDTKKKDATTNSLVDEMKPLNFSLIIASFNNAAEQKILSDFSFNNNIPLISATYPNDAGITSNPFFIMLNSTLKTHVEGIYKYASLNYPNKKILFITKQGFLEDKIKNIFLSCNQQNHFLKYNVITLTDNFLPANLLPLMDSTKSNVLICGSFNEDFGVKLIQTIGAAKAYNATVVGMPDWDAIKAFDENECKGVEIIYSTPYRFYRNDSVGMAVATLYKTTWFAKPSDMVFKGFEIMYHFTHLLMQYKTDFINHLSDTSFTIANKFFIKPVKRSAAVANSASFVPDYLENKTLYFVKNLNGKIMAINKLPD